MSRGLNHQISSEKLSLADLQRIACGDIEISLSEVARQKIVRCREYLDEKIRNAREPIYGINTGFGSLYNRNISNDQLEKLQENLVQSHACGMGPAVPDDIVRLMLFLKVQSLSYGYSGVQLSTVERLVEMFNRRVFPVVFELGSLGASGDLAPLAHLSLPLIGLGKVNFGGAVMPSEAINKKFNWPSIQFRAKEGLA
ncbi:MAG TPA: aromatic amino acid ammonia-lyase, partial [Chryseosolibacter sp.]